MGKKILSVFIDESGDFGKYEPHSPNYYVAMVLHDQSIDISESVKSLDEHIKNFDLNFDVFHTGPLIRREEVYKYEQMEKRRSIFTSLFSNVEMRKVEPVDYKLFQVADLICTLELVADKVERNSMTKSERDFFGSEKEFVKNIYKYIKKKKL